MQTKLMSTIQQRVQSRSAYFDSMVELIPSKIYLAEGLNAGISVCYALLDDV